MKLEEQNETHEMTGSWDIIMLIASAKYLYTEPMS